MIKKNMVGPDQRRGRGEIRQSLKMELPPAEVDAILDSLLNRGIIVFDLTHGEPTYWIPDLATFNRLAELLREELEKDLMDEKDRELRKQSLEWLAYHKDKIYTYVVLPIVMLAIATSIWKACDLPSPPKKPDISPSKG